MTDYRHMYYLLFNKITDVIGELQQVQKEAEELYLSAEPPDLVDITKKGQPE